MNGIQLKMARAALGLGVRDVAEMAAVNPNTITRIEKGGDARQSTIDAIKKSLESAGVQFIPQNGGGPGVRLRERQE